MTAPHGLPTALAAFALWSSAFVLLYAAQALGCRFGWDGRSMAGLPFHRLVLAAVWIAHLAALALLLAIASRSGRMPARMPWVGIAGAAAGLVSTGWTGLPLLFASACR